MLDPASVLFLIAEVSVALAGFASVVTAFGSRGRVRLSELQRFRLTILLNSAFQSMLLALFSLGLLSAHIAAQTSWRLSSVAWAVVAAVLLLWNRPSQSLLAELTTSNSFGLSVGVLTVGLIVLQAVNAAALGAFWPFYLALGFNIAVASLVFSRLLFRGEPAASTGDDSVKSSDSPQ